MKTATQIKDKIKNLAKEKQLDPLILSKNYMMERFLERIALSRFRDHFILKGGFLIASVVGIDSRSTVDIDTTLKNYLLNSEVLEVLKLLQKSYHSRVKMIYIEIIMPSLIQFNQLKRCCA